MTISRRYSYAGQGVVVTTRDGESFQGTLIGWGPRVLRMETLDGTWKEFASVGLMVTSA
jgi:hypothetical protein